MTPALDTVPGGILSLSSDLRILDVNAGLVALVGIPAAELLGRSIDVLLSAPSRILFQTHVYPALTADGRVEEVFLTLAAGEGEPVPVLLNAVRLPGAAAAEGAAPAFEALVVRIRARSRWENDLLGATKALERERTASRQLSDELAAAVKELTVRVADDERNREFRDAFIGVVSHELRTPITTIFGMSHVLRRRHGTMDPQVVDSHLDDIVEEADRLRRLTEDLLVLSRAEGGRLELASDPIVLSRVVQRAVESEELRSPGHQFVTEAVGVLPLVEGEDVYVEQVVRNFLGNATKYSPAGTTVHVRLGEENGGVALRVVDEGPGLPGGDPERLFDLFYRAPEAIGQKEGAGIGLFVCRELIRAMGGRVWAASGAAVSTGAGGVARRGAEFGFWLPEAQLAPGD